MLSGLDFENYPNATLSFGGKEPSWKYLQQPQYVSSVPASTQLEYFWNVATGYAINFESTVGWTQGVSVNKYSPE